MTLRITALLAIGMLMSAMAMAVPAAASDTSRPVHQYTLDNGMHVVVIPDNRAPVVTHMVWYRVGAADEPEGQSGIAHFLEHLMFKSTETIPSGEFSKIVSRLGGQDNAFTSQDATAYFQRISREHLGRVMEMEADRMMNLRLTDEEVRTERDVIKEERRSRVENRPSAILREQMDAALYMSHPYGTPVIGWMHEIADLNRENALSYYERFYAPNNAILVVAGDVTGDEVLKLAEGTYGKLKANPAVGAPRKRPAEPPHRAPRRLVLTDARAGQPTLRRQYLVPSYQSAKPGEAEALDLMMKAFASGATSQLYKSLVVDRALAASVSGYYSGHGLDSGEISISAIPADGVSLDALEAAIDEEIAKLKREGIADDDLDRARRVYIADYIYDMDSQSSLARRYGWGLVVGATVEQIDAWPDELRKVTAEDVKAAAAHLDITRSVTGLLIPDDQTQAKAGADQAPRSRS